MGDPLQGPSRNGTIRNTALDNLEARVRFQKPVVAQSADLHAGQFARLKNSPNKMAADLAGRSGNQNLPHAHRRFRLLLYFVERKPVVAEPACQIHSANLSGKPSHIAQIDGVHQGRSGSRVGTNSCAT